MHSFKIIANHLDDSKKAASSIKKLLVDAGWKEGGKNYDYLFIVGGDGTFIKNINLYGNQAQKIVCINAGTIGFYSEFNASNLDSFNSFIEDERNFNTIDQLEVSDGKSKFLSTNELVINSDNTLEIDIFIDNNLYERFKGSGILVCTKTGSTGYCKSLSGAIIMPNVDAIQLVEITPILHVKKLSINSPVILNSNSVITFKNICSDQDVNLIIDGIHQRQLNDKSIITVKRVKSKFKILFDNNIKAYINKLQRTFIKGV